MQLSRQIIGEKTGKTITPFPGKLQIRRKTITGFKGRETI